MEADLQRISTENRISKSVYAPWMRMPHETSAFLIAALRKDFAIRKMYHTKILVQMPFYPSKQPSICLLRLGFREMFFFWCHAATQLARGWFFLVFGLLCRHTASDSITSETHTSCAQ